MRLLKFLALLLPAGLVVPGCGPAQPPPREFAVRGMVVETRPATATAVVRHEAIPGYMAAMTMPFRVRQTNELTGLQPGDDIAFRLIVTAQESWIEQIRRVGAARTLPTASHTNAPAATSSTNAPPRLAELVADMVFTNELGREVRWRDFDGQAIGLTFLFTRCPVPDYCPRLARNFAAATRRLQTLPDAPTNWHLLALTIDPDFDTPAVLRRYAAAHGADSSRWNLLVTSKENTVRFARLFGLNYQPAAGTIEHDFRTVIVDAAGQVQAVWPIGGDTTDQLVAELINAARVPRTAPAPP
ncbi:MAG: SCO family protein [Candidatus Brachytrichaceae bacterium NZ_4S206]|jgi:protein SCO1/2